MGKPFEQEVEDMPKVYKWANKLDITNLVEVIKRLTAHSLITVGSGGSFTAAYFQSSLHDSLTGKLSTALTPYQTLTKQTSVKNVAVSVLSSEGKNKDITGCFEYLIHHEPLDALALCLKENSPLFNLARETNSASAIAFDATWGKDGYLATNSLITSCILIFRAYQQVFSSELPDKLPRNIDQLVSDCIVISENERLAFIKSLKGDRSQPFLIVSGVSGLIAGIDLESKISESATGTVQFVDFRNYAHGRHLWAYENDTKYKVIAIWSEEEKDLLEQFKKTIPTNTPLLSIKLQGPRYISQIASLVEVITLIRDIGDQYKIDPGKPTVPNSGREIYYKGVFSDFIKRQSLSNQELAIFRKFGYPYCEKFEEAYRSFIQNLNSTEFSAIVFDYDATLCTPDNRFKPLDKEVTDQLIRILKSNIEIGIATGRGKSVVKELLNAIPSCLTQNCWIGMYNGSVIQKLNDPVEVCNITGESFKKLEERVKGDPFLYKSTKVEGRTTQLTFSVENSVNADKAWRSICEILIEPEFKHLKIVRSTHSWDVVERTTSKNNVINKLKKDGYEVLSIGDRGFWPGNDCELLANNHSLGVDEVSPLINKAWNIAPQGCKGVKATLYYLNQLQLSNGHFKIQVPI